MYSMLTDEIISRFPAWRLLWKTPLLSKQPSRYGVAMSCLRAGALFMCFLDP